MVPRLVAVGCLLVLAAAVNASPLANDVVVAQRIEPGEAITVEPFQLDAPTIYRLMLGENVVLLRATPDGYIEVVQNSTSILLTVRGRRDNKIEADLQPGERVSVWPLDRLRLTAAADGQLLALGTSLDWAFVVRAEAVREGGLPTLVDGTETLLQSAERLDPEIRDQAIVFRQTGPTWPGRPVTRVADESVTESATIVVVAEPAYPGVLLDRAREFSWQTIPLPSLSWDVFRPPDVSP